MPPLSAVATATSATGSTVRTNENRREAVRQPTLMPRKQAMSTRFVKNVRKMTVLANQRMHVSSKNRIVKLTRNTSNKRR